MSFVSNTQVLAQVKCYIETVRFRVLDAEQFQYDCA